jgi:hypothetical protein
MKRSMNVVKPTEIKPEKRGAKVAPKFLTTFKKVAMCSQSDGAKFGPVTTT